MSEVCNNTIELILSRRSCRSYLPAVPSRQELEAIVETARYAPNGRNRQVGHYFVITDQALLAHLTKLVSDKLEPFAQRDFRYAAPAMIVVCSRKDCPSALQDAGCAMENMMLAATSLGLGSRWVNQMANLSDDPDLRALMAPLGLSDEERVCASLILGRPDGPLPEREERFGNQVTWVEGV